MSNKRSFGIGHLAVGALSGAVSMLVSVAVCSRFSRHIRAHALTPR